jgi:hypothetical protein
METIGAAASRKAKSFVVKTMRSDYARCRCRVSDRAEELGMQRLVRLIRAAATK